ncbi:MAG: TldD/PmbA family protein [Deltaproteobacteria bacterium]|nr:TldD/PmbA family protein [Deltaproteobacteria bacterium]
MVDMDRCRDIQSAMRAELKRTMDGLHLPGHPRPFFVSYMLHALKGLNVWGRYGSVFSSEPFEESDLYAEIRVGSAKLDQTVDGNLNTDLSARESLNWVHAPQDLDPEAIRYCLWKLTQLKYWEALKDYYDKKKILVEQHLRQDAPSFTHELKTTVEQNVEDLKFPVKQWEDFVRRTSDLFRGYKNLLDPFVNIRALSRVRVYVNSEGSRFIAHEKFYEVIVKGWHLTDDGVYLSSSRNFYGRQKDDLPGIAKVEEAVDWISKDLASLVKSEPMEPYAGPALLAGVATGLIFHEAIGHRLEGERMTSRTEGRTFASKIGKQILPKGVDLIDDPTLSQWDGQALYGHYLVDDEGVRAQPARLVEQGVLKTFLLSRSGVPGFRHSNGHGRSERHQDPMARMANLIVTSKDRHEFGELKEMMCKDVRDRHLPHGIIVKRVSSGETATGQYDFQAFKGVPTEVYSVDAKTGKETRVRDVSFIGTPLAAIQRIKAFGKDYEVDNAYCFAESGSVPVSTVAPAMLVGELELQRSTTNFYKPPILPFPPMKRSAQKPAKKPRAPKSPPNQ